MTIVYHEQDGDLSYLAGKIVSVIGYGSLGRPIALNLRDSGVNVVVGRRMEEGQPSSDLTDDFTATAIENAVRNSHIVMLMLPDEVMPEVYLQQVSPHLLRGHTLIFSSAYNVSFGYIEAPPFVDVGLIAPRILGPAVRERYHQGFHSFVAVGQDASGQAWSTVLALAKAIGSLRAGAIEVSFEQETELDLFIQQAILPAFHHIMMTAAHVLIDAGYPPEAALSDLYLSGEFAYYLEQAMRFGLMHALRMAPLTSQYGTLSRLDRFNELKLERLMEVTLEEIQAGRFAHEWAKEYSDGYRRLNHLLKTHVDMELWELEQQTLEMLGRDDGIS
jgi:ketol-acid reductoisomerase